MSKVFGYARVSTDDQTLDVQEAALKVAAAKAKGVYKGGAKRFSEEEICRMHAALRIAVN